MIQTLITLALKSIEDEYCPEVSCWGGVAMGRKGGRVKELRGNVFLGAVRQKHSLQCENIHFNFTLGNSIHGTSNA